MGEGGGAQLKKHPAQKVFDNGNWSPWARQKCHCTCIYEYSVVVYTWNSIIFVADICNILCTLQINLAFADELTGRMTGGFTIYAICGAIAGLCWYIICGCYV